MKYPCEIINDLLPLYIDDLCNEKSKEVIKEHLSSCEKCKQNYEKMKGADDIMKNNNSEDFKVAESLKNIRRKIFRNKIVVSILTIVVIAFAIFGVGTIMENIEKVIKYDNNIIVTKVNREDRGVCLEAEMTGNLMISTTQKRVEIEKNGEKEINIYFCSETNAWEDFLANEKTTSRYFIAPINEDNDIDNVYYYIGDYSNLEEMSADELDKVNENATLLWSK